MGKKIKIDDVNYSQIFSKVDFMIRDEKIKLEYKYLRESKGLTSLEAREELAGRIYKTWDGRKYMLSDKSIQRIIYDLPPQIAEFYVQEEEA